MAFPAAPLDIRVDREIPRVHGRAQGLASPLELVREAGTVDGGVLYESRDALSLVYRTRASRYNRGALVDQHA